MKFRCAHCGKPAEYVTGHVRHSRALGMNLYCSRRCSGLGRRLGKTNAQKKEEKRLYDVEYRRKNSALLKAKKHDRHLRTYDPEKARIERKKRMPWHIEYCRRPEYKAYKREYDKQYRANEYGPFAEAYLLCNDLNHEIKERMSNEQIRQQNEIANKRQRRLREEKGAERTRPRHRWTRRDRDPAALR